MTTKQFIILSAIFFTFWVGVMFWAFRAEKEKQVIWKDALETLHRIEENLRHP